MDSCIYFVLIFYVQCLVVLNINSVLCNECLLLFFKLWVFDMCCLIVLNPIHLGLHHQCKLAYVFRGVLVARACFNPYFCFCICFSFVFVFLFLIVFASWFCLLNAFVFIIAIWMR